MNAPVTILHENAWKDSDTAKLLKTRRKLGSANFAKGDAPKSSTNFNVSDYICISVATSVVSAGPTTT